MGHSRLEVIVHVIYGTKNRLPILPPPLDAAHARVAANELRAQGAQLLAFGAGWDHVHLLFRMGGTVSLAETIGKQKAATSRWLARRLDEWVGWQPGYAAFSVGRTQLAAAMAYVSNQRERHREPRPPKRPPRVGEA